MAVVSSNVRRYAKQPIPLITKMASAQLGGLTKAKMGVKHPAVTSPLQSQINLAQSMGRNPDISAPPQDVSNVSSTDRAAQAGQVEQVGQTGDAGDSLSIAQYVTILTILPQDIKQQPIRVVFAPPALSDFATKAQQAAMVNTATLVNAASRGSDVTSIEVETAAKTELQTAQGGQATPDRLNVLQSKLAQAQRNPFVNVNQSELAELYDLDGSSIDNLMGGGQVGS